MNTWTCSGERAALMAGEGDDCSEAKAVRKLLRKPAGAVATFYHFRTEPNRMTSQEAYSVVRKWSYEKRGAYAPNPLCMVTRNSLIAAYDRLEHNIGD